MNSAAMSGNGSLASCPAEPRPQHALFQLAYVCFLVACLAPAAEKTGLLFMHAALMLGFFLFAGFAWNVICAPDVFSWHFCFVVLNAAQFLHVLYTMRKVKFQPELEDLYRSMFQPLQVSRLSFKKLVNPEFSQIVSLHPGEAYAMENLTKIDHLGLLISGRANVLFGRHFLHRIQAREFLDSPEFESCRRDVEEKFKVSIVATTSCRCLVWQRQSLEFFLIKETHLSAVLSLLLSKDIARKLYAMNERMVTEKGYHLDIRLPSLTGSIVSTEESKSKKPEPSFDPKFFPSL